MTNNYDNWLIYLMEISNINDEEDIKNESENISLNEFNNKSNVLNYRI